VIIKKEPEQGASGGNRNGKKGKAARVLKVAEMQRADDLIPPVSRVAVLISTKRGG
jgi:hypothetical protein